MKDFLTRQVRTIVGGAVAPVEAAGNRLIGTVVRMASIAGVAVVALIAMIICLSIALALWLTDITGPVIATLAVAGFYFVITAICLILLLALRSTEADAATRPAPAAAANKTDTRLSENIEETVGPFVEILRQSGLKREEVAVRLAAEATKQLGPVSLVGLALAVGFLCERALDARRK